MKKHRQNKHSRWLS